MYNIPVLKTSNRQRWKSHDEDRLQMCNIVELWHNVKTTTQTFTVQKTPIRLAVRETACRNAAESGIFHNLYFISRFLRTARKNGYKSRKRASAVWRRRSGGRVHWDFFSRDSGWKFDPLVPNGSGKTNRFTGNQTRQETSAELLQ